MFSSRIRASLIFSAYRRTFRPVGIRRKYKCTSDKSDITDMFLVSHKKALHNYFIPCVRCETTRFTSDNLIHNSKVRVLKG